MSMYIAPPDVEKLPVLITPDPFRKLEIASFGPGKMYPVPLNVPRVPLPMRNALLVTGAGSTAPLRCNAGQHEGPFVTAPLNVLVPLKVTFVDVRGPVPGNPLVKLMLFAVNAAPFTLIAPLSVTAPPPLS